MKFDFKLAVKDKRLIYTLIIAAIIIAAFFGYRAIDKQVDDLDKKTQELDSVYKDLQEKASHKNEYIVKTMVYDALYTRVINSYAAGLDEPVTIMDLADMEKTTDTWINQAAFTKVGTLYTFGQITSTNPSKAGKSVYSTDMLGIGSTETISYEGTYEQLKTLINRINNTNKEYKIDSLQISYNKAEELVNGSMVVNYYAVTGMNRPWMDIDIPGVSQGTKNPFDSNTHTTKPVDQSALEKMKSDYDVYLALNAATSDVESIVLALRNDVIGTTKVSANSNDKEKVQIHITGTNGAYKISYQVGDNTYPVTDYDKGESFVPGESIDILVVSKERLSDDDKSTAVLTVINDSDKSVNLGVLNDDPENPRCIIEQTTGDIEILQ
jgi:hypothetical protein